MAKREFIDKQMMLSEYSDILDCEINHSKYENTVKEIIEEANEISEQDIVKPYLDKLKEQINEKAKEEWLEDSEYAMGIKYTLELIDNLLFEQGDKEW